MSKIQDIHIVTSPVTIIKATVGCNAGYNHGNDRMQDFTKFIQNIAEEYFKHSNVYISFVIHESVTTYRTEWGCPDGGETTFTLETSPDPEFYTTDESKSEYTQHAIKLIKMIAISLKQSTVRIEILDSSKIQKVNISYKE